MTDLETELSQNRRMCAVCVHCKRAPDLRYEAGVTWIECGCTKKARIAAPDWEVRRVREIWNEKTHKAKPK